MTAPTQKRVRKPSPRPRLQQEAEERRAQMARLAKASIERQRLVEQRRSERVAKLIADEQAERAKRIKAGKLVAPTLDEYRELKTRPFTSLGDRS
jgi:hypothetical protein